MADDHRARPSAGSACHVVLFCLSFLLIGTVGPLAAADTAEATTIHAGRLLDVRSGTYAENVLIRVEDGRVASISPAGETGARSETAGPVIDLSGSTVLPGLIDAHTHLCDMTYLGDEWDVWTLPEPMFGIHGAANARKVLEAGFTTVRNVSEPYYCGTALRDAVARGWAEGPRILASGPMISITGGHGAWGNWMAPQHELRDRGAVADGPDEVRREVRTHIRHGVDLIKLSATGGFGSHGTIPGAASYTEDEIRAAVEEAAKRGLHVAAHAHGAEGIANAVRAGVRSIEHGGLMDSEAIQLMKEHDVFLVADLLAAHFDLVETDQDWSDKDLASGNVEEYRKYAARFAEAHRAGVRIAFGTDSGVYPHGRNAEQFQLMVAAGMTPLEAIRSATTVAAELLGLGDEVGAVEAGFRADLIAVEGDPLVDVSVLTEVRFVMKGGEVVLPE